MGYYSEAKKMNKMNALLSVLFTVLLLVPATVLAADYAAISNVKVAGTVEDDDSIVTLSYTAQNTGTSKVIARITIDGDGLDSVGHSVVLEAGLINEQTRTVRIPVSELTAGDRELTATIKATTGTLDKGAEAHVVKYNVASADPDADDELLDGLVNDVEVEEDELTYGDQIEFEIELETTNEQRISDMIVEVEFDGETIETREFKMFGDDDDNVEVTLDQDDFKTMLSIPTSVDDMDEGTYDFEVRVYGREEVEADGSDGANRYHLLDAFVITGAIEVEKMDDNLAIAGVNFEQQGNVLYTAVLVENIGNNNEENVRVKVQISDLEVGQTSNRVIVYEDDDATIYAPIVLPSFATGEYDVKLTVFNDDVSVVRIAEDVEMVGVISAQPSADLAIGVDTAIKTVSPTGAVYALTFTNNGAAARSFTLETAGAEWGQTSVNPSTVVVGAGTSEIASVFVAPNAGQTGTKQFTVFVKEGNQIVKSVGLTANVEGNSVTGSAVYDFENFVDSGLKWIAAILIVVLIVLFVVWSWNKADEEEL